MKNNGKIITFLKVHLLFIAVFLLFLFLRLYRISELTTFGVDQGVDFLVVRDMVVNQKWTLIGIKSSVGEFFQGPVALYIMFPFFVLFRLNPIAGAYTALFISVLTVILLYFTVNKFFNQKAALFSCLLFAVSPELIMYGNSPLYQHFLPLVLVATFYFVLKKERKLSDLFFIGLSIGLGMELHFLNITLFIAFLLYYILNEYKGIKYLLTYFGGFLAGLLPTILFEVRHDFLNIRLFFDFISNNDNTRIELQKYLQWFVNGSRFVGGYSNIMGAILLTGFLLLLFTKIKRNSPTGKLRNLSLILFTVINLMILPLRDFFSQYSMAFWLLIIILLPVYLARFFPKKYAYFILMFIVAFNLRYSVSRLDNNHGYNMPQGMTLKKIEKIGEKITQDAKDHPNFNIAAILDGGTRAYQYRYSVLVRGGEPASYTDYPNNNYLYLVSRENFDAKTWEVSIMQPYTEGNKWDMGEGIFLRRLDRVLNYQ